jgi:hypothetical protein
VQRDEDKDDLEEGPFFLGENEMGKDNWQFEPLPVEFYFLQSGLDGAIQMTQMISKVSGTG